jgi:hypothetical protein
MTIPRVPTAEFSPVTPAAARSIAPARRASQLSNGFGAVLFSRHASRPGCCIHADFLYPCPRYEAAMAAAGATL